MLALTAIVTIPLCESTFNYNVESHIYDSLGELTYLTALS